LKPALIIDGLFGIGLNRPLSAEWAALLEMVNASGCAILAVDIPSGLNAATGRPEGAALQATVTLTVGAPKSGLLKPAAWPFVGRLKVASDVGLTACPFRSELEWITPDDVSEFPPRRLAATHKGTYGHLAILAGSLGYHGAAVLTARGAQRARPGLISLYTPQEVYGPVASQLQAVMVHPFHRPINWSEYNALVLGPGLAAFDATPQFREELCGLWASAETPMIVDASALQWLPTNTSSKGIRVITPHPGEAARLLGNTANEVQADRLAALRQLSRKLGNCIVVLKGHQTLIGSAEGQVFVNSTGNPYLAQGGSGDVLAGYLGGFLAQPELQKNPLQTVCYTVWQHGMTADKLQKTQPNWVVEDLVEALGTG
jgi:NAD(P)H-hydrate epimerase